MKPNLVLIISAVFGKIELAMKTRSLLSLHVNSCSGNSCGDTWIAASIPDIEGNDVKMWDIFKRGNLSSILLTSVIVMLGEGSRRKDSHFVIR